MSTTWEQYLTITAAVGSRGKGARAGAFGELRMWWAERAPNHPGECAATTKAEHRVALDFVVARLRTREHPQFGIKASIDVRRHFAALRLKPTEYRNHRGSSEVRRIAHIDMGPRPDESARP